MKTISDKIHVINPSEIKNVCTYYDYFDGKNHYYESFPGQILNHGKREIVILRGYRENAEGKTIKQGGYKIFRMRSMSTNDEELSKTYFLIKQNEKKLSLRTTLENFLGRL